LGEFASEPLSRFSQFDDVLRRQLLGSGWTGVKHCDFGFLLIR
jgi:hypothetical protein